MTDRSVEYRLGYSDGFRDGYKEKSEDKFKSGIAEGRKQAYEFLDILYRSGWMTQMTMDKITQELTK